SIGPWCLRIPTTVSLSLLSVSNIPTVLVLFSYIFFFLTATAPSEIYTLSLHDALPICRLRRVREHARERPRRHPDRQRGRSRARSEEHTSELQSRVDLVCRLLLEKKKTQKNSTDNIRKKHSEEQDNTRHTTQNTKTNHR